LSSQTAFVVIVPDRDHDGLPDSYEMSVGLDPDNPADGLADADNDGMTNWQEYVAGADPRDAASELRLGVLSTSPHGTALSFGAASNKTYRVEFRDSTEGTGWQILTNLAARSVNYTAVVVDPSSPPQRFYRLATPQGL